LVPLPLAFPATGFLAFRFRGSGPRCSDGIGGSTQVMRGYMRHHRSLARSECGFSGRAAQAAGRTHCMTASSAGLHHRHFTLHPTVHLLKRPTRTVISGLHLLEQRQDVLRASGCPQSQQVMIGILQSAAAPHGNQSRVRDFAENHDLSHRPPLSLDAGY
jgi:hypothetical protein